MTPALMLIISLSSSLQTQLGLPEQQAVSLMSQRVVSGAISACSESSPKDLPCLEVVTFEDRLVIHVLPIFPKSYLEKIPSSGSVFVTVDPLQPREMTLTPWPTAPITSELEVDLDELQSSARSRGERIRSSIALCDGDAHEAIDMLSTNNLNEGVKRLYSMRPLSLQHLGCLMLNIESEKPAVVEDFRPPWPSFEAVQYHGYETVGDMTIGILPMLTGAILGNYSPGLSIEERRDVMYSWLIWAHENLNSNDSP